MNFLQPKKEIMGNPDPEWVNSKLNVATFIAIHTSALRESKLKKTAGIPSEIEKYQKLDSCINCSTIVRMYKTYFCPECWGYLRSHKLMDKMSPYVCTGPDDFEAKEANQKKLASCVSRQLLNIYGGRKAGHTFSFKAKLSKLYKTSNAIALFIIQQGEIADSIDEKLTKFIDKMNVIDDTVPVEIVEDVVEEKKQVSFTPPNNEIMGLLTLDLSPTSAKTAPLLTDRDTYDDIRQHPYDDLDLGRFGAGHELIDPL